MHELSLAEHLLHIIEDAAQQQRFSRVKAVWLEIGELACVEPASLRFYFDVVTRDSIAHQAALHIIDIPGQAHCSACGKHCAISSYHAMCPHCSCSGTGLTVTQGEAMRIKELEVE
ncbi:MAG: hydrogenase maturation nickel metallochaperone HypA [Nitrosomonas sp.]|nr:MAG: hydrogenase maturation nickel metallochaperone HypA [Nitrosomonas sp.]